MTFFNLITHMFFLQEPNEDVRPPVMETESGVNDGNYCMVYTVLPNLNNYGVNIKTSPIKLDSLYTTP